MVRFFNMNINDTFRFPRGKKKYWFCGWDSGYYYYCDDSYPCREFKIHFSRADNMILYRV